MNQIGRWSTFPNNSKPSVAWSWRLWSECDVTVTTQFQSLVWSQKKSLILSSQTLVSNSLGFDLVKVCSKQCSYFVLFIFWFLSWKEDGKDVISWDVLFMHQHQALGSGWVKAPPGSSPAFYCSSPRCILYIDEARPFDLKKMFNEQARAERGQKYDACQSTRVTNNQTSTKNQCHKKNREKLIFLAISYLTLFVRRLISIIMFQYCICFSLNYQ